MLYLTPQFLFFIETILFISVIFMHLNKKNLTIIFLYAFQSLIISGVLFYSAFKEDSLLLVVVALMTFLVKVLIAPYFFLNLIRKNRLNFSVTSYLNSPLTLLVLSFLTAMSYSHFFKPLTVLSPLNENALLLALGMIFISIFLIINRKGVLSQMIGILSMENAIVSFSFIAGLEATAGLQMGILFDILVWVIIAIVFASMIYKFFGSLDTSELRQLKEK